MKAANNAPVYASIYSELAEITRSKGYALSIHGSLARDFDLVCIPWVENAAEPKEVLAAVSNKFALTSAGLPELKEHGREVHTLNFCFGECFLDLSFMPLKSALSR